MNDFLRSENFDAQNGTEISTKLSTSNSHQPHTGHTDPYSANKDQRHAQSGDILPWFQGNTGPKVNYSSQNIHNVDSNLRHGFTDLSFKPLPYDSRVLGQNIRNQDNIHQAGGHWMNNFNNQRDIPKDVPYYDRRYTSPGHPFLELTNFWKPEAQYPLQYHHSGTNNFLKPNYPLDSFNNDIYHRPDSMKYDGHHPTTLHQTQNSHRVNSYNKFSNFMSDTHNIAKDLHPHNRDLVNSHSSYNNFGYPIYSPVNFRGNYDEIYRSPGHDSFVGMARPGTERFPFESMLTKEDLESLIFDFYEPGNIFMMNEEDVLDDRMGFSKKKPAGSSNGFKYYLDKFIKKTENIVSKWGPKIEKVSDAVGLVFGFLKYVSNLPVFHLHR